MEHQVRNPLRLHAKQSILLLVGWYSLTLLVPIKNFFLCQLEIEFNVAQPYFSQDEILLSWQREAPLEFAALVEWLKSLPAEYEKGQRWLLVIESLPLRERQFRQEQERFVEGIKQGSLLDY